MELCSEGLLHYKNSLEDDEKMLEGELPQNLRNIITLVAGEKKVLHNFLVVGKKLLTVLEKEDVISEL